MNVFVWDGKRVWWFNQQERLYSNFIVMLSCHNVPWGNISKYTFYVFVGFMIVYLFHHTKLFRLIWLIWSFEMFKMALRVLSCFLMKFLYDHICYVERASIYLRFYCGINNIHWIPLDEIYSKSKKRVWDFPQKRWRKFFI